VVTKKKEHHMAEGSNILPKKKKTRNSRCPLQQKNTINANKKFQYKKVEKEGGESHLKKKKKKNTHLGKKKKLKIRRGSGGGEPKKRK